MADIVFNSVKTDFSTGNFNFSTDNFRIMLVTSAYAPSKTAHDRRNDVTNEITGTGYTAGGATIACTPTTVADNRVLTFAATSWATATFSAAGAVIYKARGGASSADELICYLDFGGTVSSSGGTFAVSATVITIIDA